MRREAIVQQSDGADHSSERLLAIVQQLAIELNSQRGDRLTATLESSLGRDLGIDSLGRAELLQRIERAFGVALPDQTLTTAETPADLLRALADVSGRPRPTLAQTVTPAAIAGGRAAPTRMKTLVAVLEFHIGAHPERPHIRLLTTSGAEQTITYGDLWQGAQSVAAGLRDHGLEVGQAVAIMLPTSADFFHAFFGALLVGGIPVPLYPPARRTQIEDHLRRQAGILGNALAQILITPPEAHRIGQMLRAQVEGLRHVTTVEQLRVVEGEPSRPADDSAATALLQYTSGSTGAPKGVILSHANLLANIRAMGEIFDVGPEDVLISWLPLYHDMGLIGAWLGSLYYACPLVLMSPTSFLTRPERWLWALHRYRGTISVAPNFAYELCADRIGDRDLEGLDLSAWRVAGNGAEPVSAHALRRFAERFAPYGFRPTALMPMYGLAEASVALTIPPVGRGPVVDRIERQAFIHHERAVSAAANDRDVLEFVGCGRPLPGHEVRVVDATGREAGERQEGRLQFRGPSATAGYFRNPEATRQLIADGWLETGDRGYIAAGEVYPTGRIKDLIIRAGRNIYPQEVEEAVGDLPGIRKGRVVAFGSREPGARAERLVVLAETRAQPDARPELERHVRELVTDLIELPPDDVVLAPPGTVLKTSSGKVRRAACRSLYEAGTIGRGPRALWWQFLRLGMASLGPEWRRGLHLVTALAYAAYFWTVVGLLVAAAAVGITVLPRRVGRRLFRRMASWAVRLTGMEPVVHGKAKRPPEVPIVLATNHASYLDGLVLGAILPEHFAFVAKRELATHLPAGFLLRRLGAVFVERFDPARGVEDARRMAPLLRAGQSLVVFVEGTFDRRPGLRSFQMGAFVVASEAGAPVVPAAIKGTRSILRSNSWFPHRGRVEVTFGRPIQPEGTTWEAAVRLRDEARAAILQACGEPDLAYEPKPVVEQHRQRSDDTR